MKAPKIFGLPVETGNPNGNIETASMHMKTNIQEEFSKAFSMLKVQALVSPIIITEVQFKQ
jgi:hypothetical protein